MKNSGKQEGKATPSKTKVERDGFADGIDSLFKLPLAQFTGARNALAAQFKKSGRGDDALRVKALGKPSITAWAVNQLYWTHRDAFDQLIASGERFHKAQTSRPAGKIADMRSALDARREALTHLSDLATSILRDAGNNPTPDTIRRVTATLEALSAYASRSDAPRAGQLTDDVDPPGFELFGSSTSGAALKALADQQPRVAQTQKSSPVSNSQKKAKLDDGRRQEEMRKAKLAAAKASVQDAKRALTSARTRAGNLELTQKKADAEVKQAEKRRRDAEANLEKAKAAAEAAALRARKISVEVADAKQELHDAETILETTTSELEKL
jgi:hypothetical protein